MHEIGLELLSHPDGNVPIGEVLRLRLKGYQGEFSCFLEQDHALYLDPLRQTSGEEIVIFPESPGDYILWIRFDVGGEFNWIKAEFRVTVGTTLEKGPKMLQVGSDQLWFPNAWEAALGASYEPELMARIEEIVHPESVVYDIGANIGLYSTRFAKLIEARNGQGWVYCFEPNPIAAQFLTRNMAVNGIRRFSLLPIALSSSRGNVELTINFGSSHLGVDNESAFAASKPGYKISVRAAALDELISDYGLRKPDVLKIDIEGAEVAAISGMVNTIHESRPTILMELHGRDAAIATLRQLESFQYGWQIAGQKEQSSAGELAANYPDKCLQVLGLPG